MAELHTLDALDLKLLHALQLDGRASFSKIASVLGVSAPTVTRRFGRLRTQFGVRVLGQVDESRLGRTRWILRLTCTPDASERLATALARRSDTRYVGLSSGGTEVLCVMAARTPEERDTLLLDKLQRTPRVTDVSAHCVLHTFYGGPSGWFAKSRALAPEQVETLTPPPAEPPAEPVLLDPTHERMIDALGHDGRTPVSELATIVGQSESSVRRRLEHLRRTGAFYPDVEVNPALMGQDIQVGLWLTVTPSALVAVGAALATHEETVFVAAVTGAPNLVAVAVCRDAGHLYRYLTDKIATLDGIRQAETAPILRQVKQLTYRARRG